jgi:hypothetical protein
MTAAPQEKVSVPVSRDILAEVDDDVRLGPEGTVDYLLKDFVLQVHLQVHAKSTRAGPGWLVPGSWLLRVP